jgi:ribonuclease Z
VRKAEALGVPRSLWRSLQDGEPVVVDGREIAPDEVLGPRRKGISLGFATDTRPVPAVRDLLRGVNLLISEGTYGDDADAGKAVAHGHMTFREAATLARDAEVEMLWLTHFGVGLTDPAQWLENARDVFPATTLGAAGLHGRISYRGGYEPADPSSAPAESPSSVPSMNAEIS